MNTYKELIHICYEFLKSLPIFSWAHNMPSVCLGLDLHCAELQIIIVGTEQLKPEGSFINNH